MTAQTTARTGDRAFAEREAALRKIRDNAQNCWLDEQQLRVVAEIMSNLPADHLAGRTYSKLNLQPAEFPDQTLGPNDLDAIQYGLVAGCQGFFIWERDSAGHATPWEITVGGRHYRGAAGLFACHMRALRGGLNILDPDTLEQLTAADIERYYQDEETGCTTLQNLEGRLAKYREVGGVLASRYGGHFANLLAEAEGWLFRDDGKGVIQALLEQLPTAYGDWPFAKLANVITRGLYQRRGASVPTTPEFAQLIDFQDVERFDCGADYYRPFFLMRVGAMTISPELREQLASEQLLPPDSAAEHEYRAATIEACNQLAEFSNTPLFNPTAETWETAFQRCRRCVPGIAETELHCPYARVCRAYNSDPALMRIRWPLTYTLRH